MNPLPTASATAMPVALQDRQTVRGLMAWLRMSPDIQVAAGTRREAAEALQRILARDESVLLVGWLVQRTEEQPQMFWASNPEHVAWIDQLQAQDPNQESSQFQVMPLYVGSNLHQPTRSPAAP